MKDKSDMQNKNNNGEEFFELPRAEYYVEDLQDGQSRQIGDLITNPLKIIEDRFTQQVPDDSMKGADIFAGDFVVLERQDSYDENSIVAVTIGNQKLVRRINRVGGRIYLQCDPPSKQMIVVDKSTPDFEIIGQVMQVIREVK